VSAGYCDDQDDDYDPYLDDPDDYYDDSPEPDEPDWGWEQERARYEEHCDERHPGTYVCDCRPSLSSRIASWLREKYRQLAEMRRRRHYTDEPPF
jgi:hypothetical protein